MELVTEFGFANFASVNHIHLDFCQPLSSGGNYHKEGAARCNSGWQLWLVATGLQKRGADGFSPMTKFSSGWETKGFRDTGKNWTPYRSDPPIKRWSSAGQQQKWFVHQALQVQGKAGWAHKGSGKSKSLRSRRNKIVPPKRKKKTSRFSLISV